MATNRVYADGRFLHLPVDSGIESGDPVMIEELPGVALTDRSDDKATIDTSGVYKLKVVAKTEAEATAKVEVGAKLYYNDGTGNHTKGDLIPDDDAKTEYFGYALEVVDGDADAVIEVKIGY